MQMAIIGGREETGIAKAMVMMFGLPDLLTHVTREVNFG